MKYSFKRCGISNLLDCTQEDALFMDEVYDDASSEFVDDNNPEIDDSKNAVEDENDGYETDDPR